MLALYAEGIGLTIAVVIITFLSLVLGELMPKRIGLANPEGIAIVMAKPMHRLSVITGPVVRVLSISTEALFAAWSDATQQKSRRSPKKKSSCACRMS